MKAHFTNNPLFCYAYSVLEVQAQETVLKDLTCPGFRAGALLRRTMGEILDIRYYTLTSTLQAKTGAVLILKKPTNFQLWEREPLKFDAASPKNSRSAPYFMASMIMVHVELKKNNPKSAMKNI